MKADPALLALLEKTAHPCTSLPLNIKVKGVYALP